MRSEDLVEQLVADCRPGRPLAAPWRRALLWLLVSAAYVALVAGWHGFLTGPDAVGQSPRATIEAFAALATAVAAAFAAFAASVPGQNRLLRFLPLPPLALWLASVGAGCAAELGREGAGILGLAVSTKCLPPLAWMSAVPLLAILVMIRAGAPGRPALVAGLAGLAVAALANVGLALFHQGDASVTVLVSDIGVVLVFAALTGWLGPRLIWAGGEKRLAPV